MMTSLVRGLPVLLLCAACGGTPKPVSPDQPASGEPTPVEAGPKPAELVGHWTGDWGDLYVHVEADGTLRGVYPHDTGTVTGRYDGSVFTGWWCEAPSRQPSQDAGEVEFRFANTGGTLALDGRWRYGVEGDWREDWNLHWVDASIDPALEARFADASQFCARP